jgi:hypothetical protein
VPQVNRDWAAELKMGLHKKQTAKSSTPAEPVAPKVKGPWPSMLTTAFLLLLGPLGMGLRFTYLEQNPASHPLARMERQLVATLFGITSFGIATPFIGWTWFRASRKSFDLILAAISLFVIVGFFALVTIGVSSGEGSELYQLTTSSSSFLILALFVLIPLIGFRAPKIEKPKKEDKAPEQT